MDTLGWLLDGDPAIRWQAMRDLTNTPPETVAAERARVAREGIGAEILCRQEADGAWRRTGRPDWQPTLFGLLMLRATGVDPADPAVMSAMARAEAGLRWSAEPGWNVRPPEFGGNAFWAGEEEPCINGGVLAMGSYFGHPSEALVRRLLGEQLEDGGWNCEAPAKSSRSSFHTTICVLEGLLEYERAAGSAPEVAAARERGEEYLLVRSLFRRRSSGEVVDPQFLELAFPPRYRYDVLRSLDYFRAAGSPPDPRMQEAAGFLASRQQPDGRWLLDRAYDESLPTPHAEAQGQPSRWNTLRALRVLRWYQNSPAPGN